MTRRSFNKYHTRGIAYNVYIFSAWGVVCAPPLKMPVPRQAGKMMGQALQGHYKLLSSLSISIDNYLLHDNSAP